MKKFLFILSLVVFTSSAALAQETSETVESKTVVTTIVTTVDSTQTIAKDQKKVTIKAKKGDFNVELMFNPFNFNGGTFGLDGLRARVFCSDRIALRLHIGISAGDTLTKFKIGNAENKDLKTGGFFAFSFVPGLEFHLGNLKRLSPYVGFDLGVGWLRAFNKGYTGFTFTVGAICGVDFYVYKGLYLGAEFALRYNLNTITLDSETRQSASEFGFIPVPSIRLGWKF